MGEGCDLERPQRDLQGVEYMLFLSLGAGFMGMFTL